MKKILLCFIALIFAGNLFAQELEKIVAVVDNEIIMKSELDMRVAMEAASRNLNPRDEKLIAQVLENLMTQKLLYAQAELDSVVVSDEEVEQQLDYQLNYFIQQYGSKERVEEAYGMSIEKIKREFKDDTRKSMMGDRVKQQKFGMIDVTRREVEEFFNDYKDSLGVIPEKYTLSHIFVNPKATEKVKKKARDLAQTILDSINIGVDFAELAKKYSDDPGSKAQGGDLGTVKRGVFYPEFEAAAFALKPGELSGIVESPVGFHIIQLIDRKGDAIHTRHILVKIKADDEADLKAIEFLSVLRDSIVRGEKDFEYFAKEYSDDKETSVFGGDLGTFELSQLDKSLMDQVFQLKEGEIGYPKRLQVDPTTYGFHILKLVKRTKEHKANLDLDFEDIKKLAKYRKQEKLYKDWVKELKEHIYWKVNL